MSYEVNYPGVLVPALTDYPYITEAKYVKGGYIVAPSVDYLYDIDVAGLVDGTPAYVYTTNAAYRYNASTGDWESEYLPEEVKAELEQQLAQERLARQQAISAEANARQSADNSLRADLNQEITNRTSADSALGVRIDTNASNISTEVTRATGAESALSGRIDTNVSNISTNSTRITNETTRATNAESALGTRVTNETTARENADTAINNRINESCVWVSF